MTEFSIAFDDEMIAMMKKFILFFLRIFRRALCCFSRKRSDSNSQYEDRLEVVNVDSPSYGKSNTVKKNEVNWNERNSMKVWFQVERDWNTWDDSPKTVEEHIERYRENLVKPKEPEPVDIVENIDLFAVCIIKKAIANEFLMRFRSILLGYDTEDSEAEKSSNQPGAKRTAAKFLTLRSDGDCRNSHNGKWQKFWSEVEKEFLILWELNL